VLARRAEHVARAGHVDAAGLLAAAHDDEGEVDEHVGVAGERVDGLGVEHVALAVLELRQVTGVERPPRHAEHARDLAVALQRAQERAAELARRAGDGDDHSSSSTIRAVSP
jgi:hypothetical protein